MPLVSSDHSYLQDYLPRVGQVLAREGWVDMIGLGRMVLSYLAITAHCLSIGTLKREQICRTFSDYTTTR